MTGNSILARFGLARKGLCLRQARSYPDMHDLWRQPARLPPFVATTPGALRVLDLPGPLDWAGFPERNLERNWGQATVPYAALAAACLLKLNEGPLSMGKLRSYLLEHPGFIWLCGFPLVPCRHAVHGFDAEASLPTQRHLTQMVRHMPNTALQFLLTDSVRLIGAELRTMNITPGDCIVLDTKHIIAWVKENNPKAYVEGRYDKGKQPAGDPDCRLGCKRRHNRQPRQPVLTPSPLSPSPRRVATRPKAANSARRGCHFALRASRCHSSSHSSIAPLRSSSTSAASMSARSFICTQAVKPVRSTTRTGPGKGAQP